MTAVQISRNGFRNCKDKVVVMTGGTTGIGASVVEELASIGAHVVFGDVKDPATPASSPHVTFVQTDVTKYDDVVNLFREAWRIHGRVDHAISNAAVTEIGQLFATGTDDSAIEEAPPTMVSDVNIKGTVFFARVAVHYLRKSLAVHRGAQEDASLLLVSSVAVLNDSPGLFQYSASKYGIMGLFRSSHKYLLATEGIRVNVVLPNLTRTQMAAGVVAQFDALSLPSNEPQDVAYVFMHALSSGSHGEALYVSGGRTYEIEKDMEAVKCQWLGRTVYEELIACNEALGDGSNWTQRKGGSVDDYDKGQLM